MSGDYLDRGKGRGKTDQFRGRNASGFSGIGVPDRLAAVPEEDEAGVAGEAAEPGSFWAPRRPALVVRAQFAKATGAEVDTSL